MDKFGRNYELEVQAFDGSLITIRLPFTIEFDITRNTLTSANVCQIRIYNLSEVNRNRIRRNVTSYGPPFQGVTLRAGYGDNTPVVFSGNITAAWSVREGVDFITQIECYDGGFAFVNGRVDAEFASGTTRQQVITELAKKLPHVELGVIGDYVGSLTRANAYSGNTTSILQSLTGGGFFIDSGKANALNTNEYISTPATLVVNAQSGLLATPVLERTIVRFEMIFEPSLNVGYQIYLESLTEENFTGFYKVVGVKHRGMISGAVAGTVITTGEFFYTKLLTPVAP